MIKKEDGDGRGGIFLPFSQLHPKNKREKDEKEPRYARARRMHTRVA
jgi:hypothetical protein